MSERRFARLWQQLQSKKSHLPHFLTDLQIDGIRGIEGLRVVFDYPVSVVAGGNASGKSTVLFAAACAYKVPGAGVKDFVPSTLFPDDRPRIGAREDSLSETSLVFQYTTPGGPSSMRWRRSKNWNRSFFGRQGAVQPERPLFLRTLSNAEGLEWEVPEVCRTAGRVETNRSGSDIEPLVRDLETILMRWRT